MGLFDKITSGAKKLGDKLTSEETKESLKSGLAKASSGVASGLNKISNKLSDTPADLPAENLSLDEIIRILTDNTAAKARWQVAYRSAAPLQLDKEFPTAYYVIQALGIWRGVSPQARNPYLARNMQLANHEHDKLVLDETGVGDRASDLLWDVEEVMDDMMVAVFEMLKDKEEKDFLDCYYLGKVYLNGSGCERNYRLGWLYLQDAIELNQSQPADEQDMNDTNMKAFWGMFNKGLEQFNDALTTLGNEDASDSAWAEATDAIVDMYYLATHQYVTGILMLYRGTIEEQEGITDYDRATDTALLAWGEGEPHIKHLLNIIGYIAEIMPDTFAGILERAIAEKDEEERASIYAASAYMYGWGVEADLEEAGYYAADVMCWGDEYEDIATMMYQEIEKLQQGGDEDE